MPSAVVAGIVFACAAALFKSKKHAVARNAMEVCDCSKPPVVVKALYVSYEVQALSDSRCVQAGIGVGLLYIQVGIEGRSGES